MFRHNSSALFLGGGGTETLVQNDIEKVFTSFNIPPVKTVQPNCNSSTNCGEWTTKSFSKNCTGGEQGTTRTTVVSLPSDCMACARERTYANQRTSRIGLQHQSLPSHDVITNDSWLSSGQIISSQDRSMSPPTSYGPSLYDQSVSLSTISNSLPTSQYVGLITSDDVPKRGRQTGSITENNGCNKLKKGLNISFSSSSFSSSYSDSSSRPDVVETTVSSQTRPVKLRNEPAQQRKSFVEGKFCVGDQQANEALQNTVETADMCGGLQIATRSLTNSEYLRLGGVYVYS